MSAVRLTAAAGRLLRTDGSVIVPPGAAGPLLRLLERTLRGAGSRNGGGALSAELAAVAEALAASALGDWPQAHGRELVPLPAYAARVGCSPEYARRLARAGRIAARRVGRAWLVAVPTNDDEEARSA